jgi:hypothetical protein
MGQALCQLLHPLKFSTYESDGPGVMSRAKSAPHAGRARSRPRTQMLHLPSIVVQCDVSLGNTTSITVVVLL